jgi:phosphonate transport system substrate-binding protein
LEVLRALQEDRADVGALGHPTWLAQLSQGHVDTQRLRLIWTSPGYSHCNFTTLADFPADLARRWTDALVAMRYEDPCWRPLMELEGLRRWLPATPAALDGYRVLFDAVEHQALYRER